MSDKTLKRLVLGQLVLLVVIAAVLVWVIFPDGANFAWRGFYQPQNPATLEGGIQWPVAIRTEEARQSPDPVSSTRQALSEAEPTPHPPLIQLEDILVTQEPTLVPTPVPGLTPIILENYLIPDPTPMLPVIQPDSSGAGGIDFDMMDVEARQRLLDQVGRGLGSNFGIDVGPSVAKILSNELAQNPSREFTAAEQDWLEQYLSEQARRPWLDPDPEPGSWEEAIREQERRWERESRDEELRELNRRIDCLARKAEAEDDQFVHLSPGC